MRPTIPDSLVERHSRESGSSDPFSDRKRLSIVGDAHVGSLVATLRKSRYPSCVGFAVWSVDINALNREPILPTLPHVCKEASEGFPCRLSYFDSATSVVGVEPIFLVGASGPHVTPTAIQWVVTTIVSSVAVLEVNAPMDFGVVAAARCGIAAFKIVMTNKHIATVAPACAAPNLCSAGAISPHAVFVMIEGNDGKPSESLAA